MDIKEKKFHNGLAKPWRRLLREVVKSPSLQIFKTQLDLTLSNMM